MGTTLTGTTPQDTYDSLIKVTDNGPLSGTAKYLSDGLGNDSVLALSTSRVGILTNSPQAALHLNSDSAWFGNDSDFYFSARCGTSGNYYHLQNGAIRTTITSAGNVGIGTSSPAAKLDVSGAVRSTTYCEAYDGTRDIYLNVAADLGLGALPAIQVASNHGLQIATNNGLKALFTTDGYLRMHTGTAGIQFNGDTAAANALDDYEEGAWTPTYVGGTTAGTYTASSQAYYTKIGRQVTVYWYSSFTAASGGSGYLEIGGLPFNYVSGSAGTIGAVASTFLSYTADTIFAQVTTSGSGNTLLLAETASGVDVTLVQATDVSTSTTLRVSMTYFV